MKPLSATRPTATVGRDLTLVERGARELEAIVALNTCRYWARYALPEWTTAREPLQSACGSRKCADLSGISCFRPSLARPCPHFRNPACHKRGRCSDGHRGRTGSQRSPVASRWHLPVYRRSRILQSPYATFLSNRYSAGVRVAAPTPPKPPSSPKPDARPRQRHPSEARSSA
jgi:hypothetical protein